MKGILFAVSMMLSAASFAADGPFGLAAGMTQDQISSERGRASGAILIDKVPNPYPGFDTYIGMIGERGLTSIRALSRTMDRASAEKLFRETSANLADKYGAPTLINSNRAHWGNGKVRGVRAISLLLVSSADNADCGVSIEYQLVDGGAL